VLKLLSQKAKAAACNRRCAQWRVEMLSLGLGPNCLLWRAELAARNFPPIWAGGSPVPSRHARWYASAINPAANNIVSSHAKPQHPTQLDECNVRR
jgi:hypothetical protein